MQLKALPVEWPARTREVAIVTLRGRALSPVPDASQLRGEPRRFGAVWRVEVVSFCEDLEFRSPGRHARACFAIAANCRL